jgi:hypothetical protein
MEANHPPKELFLNAYSRFYNSLKKRYLDGIEKAADKDYAQDYYCRLLFTENELTPSYSVFYLILISTFTHHKKLGKDNPIELTLKSLPVIKEMASNMIEQTIIIHSSLSDRFYQLNWLYVKAIEEKSTSILELINTEQRLLKYSNEKVVLLLALDQATQVLSEEYSVLEDDSNRSFFVDPLITPQTIGSKFTRSQQVLIAYYISQLFGRKHKKNVSKCAVALHDFLEIPYTQITNSELYKKLLHPLTFSSAKTTLLNLEIIRSFFKDTGFDSAIALIDVDIETVKRKLE